MIGAAPQGAWDQDLVIQGVAIDSRKVEPGNLFVCLPGEKVDGHAYARAAIEKGAVAILAQRPLPDCGAPVWQARSCEKALGRVAAALRKQTGAKVIGITGTAGKTTLKDAIAAMLRQQGKVAATPQNHNNQIGLPLTIANAAGDEDFWVIELGISHEGDMDYLGDILRPDLAVILNAGPGHTEGLGKKGVAWHKARLINYLAPAGMALVNSRYDELARESRRLTGCVAFFGGADDAFSVLDQDGEGRFVFRLQDRRLEVATPFRGAHGWENALAAAAVCALAGMPLPKIQAGFKNVELPCGRFNCHRIGSHTLYDDTYNANPLSMRAMIEAAASQARKNGAPLVLILGEMGELGENAASCHYELGSLVKSVRPAALLWKGGHAGDVRAGLETTPGHVPFFALSEPQDLRKWLQEQPASLEGAVFLVKGSRMNHLEEHFRALAAMLAGEAPANAL